MNVVGRLALIIIMVNEQRICLGLDLNQFIKKIK